MYGSLIVLLVNCDETCYSSFAHCTVWQTLKTSASSSLNLHWKFDPINSSLIPNFHTARSPCKNADLVSGCDATHCSNANALQTRFD